MEIDWTDQLAGQLDWYWRNLLRPRLDGLSDDEYFWEPVPGGWSVRPRGTATSPMAAGAGEYVMDFAHPEPDPAPVTSIAWRLGHIIVGVLGMRVAGHFGGPPVDYQTFQYAGTAGEALAQLDTGYAAWLDGVRSLRPEDFARPSGPAEAPHEDLPLAALVLHINREVFHHGAEIALLRDLYLRRHVLGEGR